MKKINNKFLDLLKYIASFFRSIVDSFLLVLWTKKTKISNPFFRSLNFIFVIWPKYFWKKPTMLKLTRFISDFINYVFYKK